MDAIDRALINHLQGGFPICDRPFARVAGQLGLDEEEVIERIGRLRETRTLSRFGPLYDAERLGGGVTLAAMAVPEERFEEIAAIVNDMPEVAHNYQRSHTLNMWFVVATEQPQRVAEVLREIEGRTGIPVLDMPKSQEFFLELRLDA